MAEPVISRRIVLTPREEALQQQIEELERKVQRITGHTSRAVADAKRATFEDAYRRASAEFEGRLEALRSENEYLETRIGAGMYRRVLMYHVCCALVRCEDDPSVTDEEYERCMDAAVRCARTVVSIERLAREEDRARRDAKEPGAAKALGEGA